jgi:hypothetical protein
MNRRNIDDIDGRESPALASSSHLSPRPRVARRGGAHAPTPGVLAGLASTNDCGDTSTSCVFSSESSTPKGRASSVAEHRGRPRCRLLQAERPSRFALNSGKHSSGKALEVRHGTERCCSRIGRRVTVVRRLDGREVPLHDASCDLSPDQPVSAAVHPRWSKGSLRPRCP